MLPVYEAVDEGDKLDEAVTGKTIEESDDYEVKESQLYIEIYAEVLQFDEQQLKSSLIKIKLKK